MTETPTAPDERVRIAAEAYLFGFPLAVTEATRRLSTNVPEGVRPGFGPMNWFTHVRAFPPGRGSWPRWSRPPRKPPGPSNAPAAPGSAPPASWSRSRRRAARRRHPWRSRLRRLDTSDLAQFTFAADRVEGGLWNLLDPWQPAPLKLIARPVPGPATTWASPSGSAVRSPPQ